MGGFRRMTNSVTAETVHPPGRRSLNVEARSRPQSGRRVGGRAAGPQKEKAVPKSLTRTKSLLLAALRLWELKRGPFLQEYERSFQNSSERVDDKCTTNFDRFR